MFDNDNPKVIVDDDFLDLRNDQSKYPRVRPPSTNTRGSSSFHPQGNANTIKDVFPGLKRIINNYNQKNSKPSFSQKIIQPVDSRFRRKIEKEESHLRPDSIQQESTEKDKEKIESESSDLSTPDPSSVSEKHDSVQLERPVGKLSWKHDKMEKFSRINKEPNKNNTNGENERVTNLSTEKEQLEEELERSLQNLNNSAKRDIDNFRKAKNIDIKDHKKIYLKKDDLVVPQRFYTFTNFKKCWTIPSTPLIQRSFSWTKHSNILCNKVDRETYEFDTDDTISDSEDKISLYSTISRNNYINLIFCLGCLCGIFLIGGVLTASEIQVDYLKPMESDRGMLMFFYEQISYTIRVIFSICYQILTFPATSLFRLEQPRPWGFFNKFLYFVLE